MRKDVRIGLSIGGVLLAVLIVYLLVPKDNTTGRGEKSQLAQKDAGTSGSTGGDTSGAGGSGATSPDSSQPAPNNGNSTPGGNTTPGDASPGQGQDRTYAGGTTGTGTGTGTGSDSSSPTGGGTDASAQADANATNVDWLTILNKGVIPDSMMATKRDPFADDTQRGGNAGGSAPEAQRNTPGPTVDWGAGGTGTHSTANPQTTAPQGGSSVGATGTGSHSGSTGTPAGGSGAPMTGIKEHAIQRGETFSTIALMVYGDARFWTEIKKANPTVDDRRLKVGTVIKLPDAATVKAGHSPATAQGAHAAVAGATMKAEPSIDPSREYRVQPNDSLQKIATKLYGKPAKWESIYEANKDKIGADEHRLKVGMVLKLSEPPTASPTAAR